MIYDTLFSMDESFTPQPQMVEALTTSDGGLVWTFNLRTGLKWHDSAPVTAADCVASLERWRQRDGMGQQLFAVMDSIVATDPEEGSSAGCGSDSVARR